MSAAKRGDRTAQPRDLRAETAARLEAIVAAAERAAERVIDDAEAQARRYLAQARAEADRFSEGRLSDLSDLVDALLGQARSLRCEAERLQATLEDAQFRLETGAPTATGAEDGRASMEEPPETRPPRLRAVAADEEPAPLPEASRNDAAGARLLATQLAVAGSSREEIEDRLRNRFEIEDPKAILDAILGPED